MLISGCTRKYVKAYQLMTIHTKPLKRGIPNSNPNPNPNPKWGSILVYIISLKKLPYLKNEIL